MFLRLIRNDILKSKLISCATVLFIAVATMLVSLASILTINLIGSMDSLMTKAKTPDFMQMHTGEIDHGKLASFAQKQQDVNAFQVLNFLNIDNHELRFEGISLNNSTQDNGLSIQSDAFDYLLDVDGNVIHPKKGELYVPIGYKKDNTTNLGERVSIYGHEFLVAGFLRDSQMNSTLSSSKRFLVHEEDYANIEQFGKTEYLIEFRLQEGADIGAFERAYTEANLPANGPMVTYQLFQTLNAFSDGIMIGVILMLSFLVVAIAFMCIRFTLLAKIEEDYRELGVMKAIGLRSSHIQSMYVMKYAALAFIGCLLGYMASLLSQGMLTENIKTFMGESEFASMAPYVGIFGIVLVFLAILIYVKFVLRRFRKISASQAIRFGSKQDKKTGANYLCLSTSRFISSNVFLGIKDVLTRKSLYITMLMVLILASFIMIVPLNMYHTISAKSFSTYMGIGNSDLRLDIQQTDNIEEKAESIMHAMKADDEISKVGILTTKSFKTQSDETLKVELGDHTIFPIAYAKGQAPTKENEIALSATNAEELEKDIFEHITLFINGQQQEFVICGIYSDITNGGKSAKAVFQDETAATMWSIISAEVGDKEAIGEKVLAYKTAYSFAKVSHIEEYIGQTFGQTIGAVKLASTVAIVVGILITMFVTLLFMKMLIAKDKYSITIMKASGFTNTDILVQYTIRAIVILIIGVLLGTILANTLGEALAGMVISSFGASSFQFYIHPISAYVLCPTLMTCSVLIATILGTTSIKKIKISENIKE